MITTLKNAWKIHDLRKRALYTLLMLVVFRIGSSVPVPGIDIDIIKKVVDQAGLLSFYDMVAGGAFSNFTIFALSITPYITASIVIQLLTFAIPSLEELSKSGEDGRKKITQYTRLTTIALALLQSTAISVGLFNNALISKDAFSVTVVVLTLTAGTTFLMWLGEQITEKGIGNGISLIIFVGIISRLPGSVINTYRLVREKQINIIQLIIFGAIGLAIVVSVIAITQATRKIPVQYAKKVVGRTVYGGQSTHIPMKVNQAGVIPVIFASSMLVFPQTLTLFFKGNYQNFINKWLSPSGDPGIWIYMALEVILIIFFAYFYTSITFNVKEISDNMKNSGGFIPGIRPGRSTEEYLNKILMRLTLAGAVFLALIAVLPMFVFRFTTIPFGLGGTGLLIVVGVALETMKQVEAKMVVRHYQGFLK
ncbi:protein translocase subunit secY/sec61 alpha [Alkalithermobacter thermoalcaliphilus JW-YL-7 = DSM 7308]|uniref:Protein translocase subunit SecY n=1 Tax=Alkalithermobacter thermoalcaliphilus JW-YL-7 = DSM 7308 TaxID=1121328 RepID=A0A150FMY6_CLOPD|nr:Protein translocase subunit SecY [[Clostridium] paradoxum JW-YL-7 = DSM 7308]SHL23729.1 protein translocase subunit secY/sec61 alpha [[Clostridium] paradoxum JW-YL-7 = DSM 7308]